MSLSLCTIEGVIYDAEGDPAVNAIVVIHKVIKSGTVLQYKKKTAGRSDALGAISFTAPRDSNIWLSGAFYIGSLSFENRNGVSVIIPDSATATLESLGGAVVIPTPNVRSVTTTASAASTDDILFADTTAAGFALTLMSAGARTRLLIIKVLEGVGDNLLTVTAAVGETINGAATMELYAGDSITLVPRTATAWETI